MPKDAEIIEDLYRVVVERKKADPAESYTALLYKKGIGKICQKIGEEATEVIVDAMKGSHKGVREESADLLYHLLVLWADMGVEPHDIWKVLHKRFIKQQKKD